MAQTSLTKPFPAVWGELPQVKGLPPIADQKASPSRPAADSQLRHSVTGVASSGFGHVAVVAVRSVPELELEDLTQVLQELDGVVHGGLADHGKSTLDLADLVRGGVALALGQDLQDDLESVQSETQSQRRREAAVSDERTSSVPEPISAQAPGGFAAAEPLPHLIRRIVREELRPIHLLLEERGDRSTGGAASGGRG